MTNPVQLEIEEHGATYNKPQKKGPYRFAKQELVTKDVKFVSFGCSSKSLKPQIKFRTCSCNHQDRQS